MEHLKFRIATSKDIEFIKTIYDLNIESLHGEYRNLDTWANLIRDQNKKYYIVHSQCDLGWFRIDEYGDHLELGMIQIDPRFHRHGIGKFIISVTENIAKENNYKSIIIHTTEDNIPAQRLYISCGYKLIEVGECLTADGKTRMGHTYFKNIE